MLRKIVSDGYGSYPLCVWFGTDSFEDVYPIIGCTTTCDGKKALLVDDDCGTTRDGGITANDAVDYVTDDDCAYLVFASDNSYVMANSYSLYDGLLCLFAG